MSYLNRPGAKANLLKRSAATNPTPPTLPVEEQPASEAPAPQPKPETAPTETHIDHERGSTSLLLAKWMFSSYEYSVLLMILDLSGPDGAYIRKKDFGMCGVTKTNIGKVLRSLHEARVIEWNELANHYRVRVESQHEWKVSVASGFDDERYRQLKEANQKQ